MPPPPSPPRPQPQPQPPAQTQTQPPTRLTARGFLIVAIGTTCVGLLISLSFGYADHSPSPHDVRVEIVGPPAAPERIQAGLDRAIPGGFKVVPASSTSSATDAILNQKATGALIIPQTGPTTTLIAGAGGLTASQAVTSALAASSRAIDRPSAVHDLAPLPKSDRAGLTAFVFELGLLIPSVLFSVGIFLVGRALRIWYRVAAAVVFVLLVSAANVIAQYAIIGSFRTAPLASYGIAVLGCFAFVLFVAACQAVIGVSGTALGAVAFIFVGNALSGGTTPIAFLPDVYRQIAPWLPNSAIISGVRSVVYFGGRSLGHPLLVLSIWAGLAVIVIAAVDLLHTSELRQTPAPPAQVCAGSAVASLRARSERRRVTDRPVEQPSTS